MIAGGDEQDSRGVFVDLASFVSYDKPPNVNGVPIRNQPNGAFIIGNDGLWIPGYSDDETLKVKYPFASLADIKTYRKQITNRRVLLALPVGKTPQGRDVEVNYVVYGDDGVQNIDTGPVEYLTLGDAELSYDEEPLRMGRRM